jgi:hypothetical protein
VYDAKNDQNRSRKGSISYTIGDRKYFGGNIDNIFNKGKGFYCNVHHRIFDKFK